MILVNRLKKLFILFTTGGMVLACGQLSVGVVTPTATVDPVAAIVNATMEAIEPEGLNSELDNDGAVNRDDMIFGESPVWLTNDQIPTGLTLPQRFAGLVYRKDNVWLVDQVGVSHLVMGQPFELEISPDGTGFLYSSSMNEGEDIYYLNLASGDVSQFTNTPDIFERGYQWWPERNNVIVFNFIPDDRLGPWYGYLGAYDLMTSEYIIIDGEEGSGSAFSLSPDGQRIAFNKGKQPMIYTWGQGSQPIDIEGLGLDYTTFQAPAWSPDGKQIAFFAGGGGDESSGGNQSATVIINLETNTAKILHQFVSFGQRVGPEIVWHPDGEWLAVLNPGEIDAGSDPMAMWVMRVDGTEEHYFGFSSGMIWSPDGQYMVYIEWPSIGSDEEPQNKLVEFGVWQPAIIDELQGSYIDKWIYLP